MHETNRNGHCILQYAFQRRAWDRETAQLVVSGLYIQEGVLKKILIVAVAMLLFSGQGQAFDIRDYVSNLGKGKEEGLIVPDESIFGVPYGTAEDQFIEQFGKPVGYVRISERLSGMIYGKEYMFFFTEGALSGLRITHSILDWEISELIVGAGQFKRFNWTLNNNVSERTSLAEAKKTMGEKLKETRNKSKWYYDTEESRVTLHFGHYVAEGDTDDAYILSGIMVQKK